MKPFVFAACLIPAGVLVFQGLTDGLGANPIERITHATGDWTLRFLLITLAVTPARHLLKRPELIRFRRMLGLFAFFYACLHFLTYVWLDQFFDWESITRDVRKRPFITAGFAGFVMMLPLAMTSTAGWIRRLGGKQWRMLHRLIYVSAAAGVVHYWWLVKSDIREPLAYGVVLLGLLAYRAWAAGATAPSRSRHGLRT
ncbi:MAG TPA: protein-methionine-sulfoxide reductase heme-binding subunit MsrQ [Bryobacteraceae bacterium]|nr:protein-methionine-sulfoxide reductase heme-binding subunit MsrQ [Bryobacteraceae bacterium]